MRASRGPSTALVLLSALALLLPLTHSAASLPAPFPAPALLLPSSSAPQISFASAPVPGRSPSAAAPASDLAPPPSPPAPSLALFVDPLPTPAEIRLPKHGHAKISAYKVQHTFHRDLPPTWVYAYGESEESASVPGPTLRVERDGEVHVEWGNELRDDKHLLPVDYTLGAPRPPKGGIPTVVHLHGGVVESESDGHPDAWWTARGDVGPMYAKRNYTYHNVQPACTMWYHDHVDGMTRLNVVMGLAGFYIVEDPQEQARLALPSGEFDVPLLLQDRSFSADGQLDFPQVGDNPGVHPFWFPEYFGEHITVNGKVAPYLTVQRRKYRFRLLNGANARFFGLSLHATYGQRRSDGRARTFRFPFFQIASDGGLLAEPVKMKGVTFGPGERIEIVVDFSGLETGAEVRVLNSAPAPYIDGDAPDRSQKHVMLFKVEGPHRDDRSRLPAQLAYIPPADIKAAVNYAHPRVITMVEVEDEASGSPDFAVLEGKRWMEPVSVMPHFGDSELWQIVNLTPDYHPFHVHFTPHRVISRRPFDVDRYRKKECVLEEGNGRSCYTGRALGPERNEKGWKDTTVTFSGHVTTILLRFDPWEGKSLPFDPTKGPGYVFHCHILDHEDNDMMRPFRVLPPRTK